EKAGSPYRFNTARMSNGQDFLTLRDSNGEFKGTRAFSEPRPGDNGRDAQKPAGDKVPEASDKRTPAPEKNKLEKMHQQVADKLKQIFAQSGDDGVANAVENLNKSLEKANSPYRFNTARMSNGQDFVTLRTAKDHKFVSTVPFSEPRK